MKIAFFQPRAIHSINSDSTSYFAIHEVYFRHDGTIETLTVDALSPRFNCLDELKEWLKSQVQSGIEKVVCGDLSFEYESAELRYWLDCVELPVIKIDAAD